MDELEIVEEEGFKGFSQEVLTFFREKLSQCDRELARLAKERSKMSQNKVKMSRRTRPSLVVEILSLIKSF